MVDYLLFGLFGATLLGIARFHKHALRIALGGLGCVLAARLALTDFDLGHHLGHEWQNLVNLGGLLIGFALLANFFERSKLPEKLTDVLPGGQLGAFVLLVLVAVMSSVLDNIAAALIGGSAAITLFRRKVHVGYLAAIVAASNAGGAGSVVGDTTTTMMWLAGASPLAVAEAALGAVVAVAFFGFWASRQQHALQPLVKSNGEGPAHPVDYAYVGIVVLILVGAIGANLAFGFPAAGVWAAILVGCLLRRPDWKVIGPAAVGMCFLLSLVMSASMMPVEQLPPASAWTAAGLGIVSAFFDNIPLTALAIKQGGYDWGYLAFCVGYGGSMLWFGSSAGVAISGLFHEAKSAKNWLVQGWHVAVGYVLGFLAMYFLLGWHPEHLAKPGTAAPEHGAPPAYSVPGR
ncbi:MAG: citrate transporter [Planctomycetes bacterium]|nr:citrate transporter [Planctomycetota bacterium]